MKRRLAFLLALSLTFASLPVTGASAAETAAATETEVVTEIAQEEASDEGVSVETEAVDLTEEDKNEAAAGEQKQEETVSEENAAAAETTDEIAAEVEPEVITEGKDAKQEASVKNGWVNEGSSRYYYNQGKAVTNWQKIDGAWYYFNGSGAMQTGWQWLSNKWYYFDENDGTMQLGFKELGDRTYYFTGSGAMGTGWQKIDNAWYYFNGSGVMQTGWQRISNKWYYFDENDGTMQLGLKELGGRTYYFTGSGAMGTGWQKIDNGWYYFNGSGVLQTGWQKVGDRWFYMSDDEADKGKMVTGWKTINGRKYYFDPSGAMATGWRKDGGYWYLFGPGGNMLTDWQQVGSDWYYLLDDGKMTTGWITNDGKDYYLDPTHGGAMANTPRRVEKRDGSGYEYYFFYSTGSLGKGEGWKWNDGYYYTHEDGSLYRNTTLTIDGIRYQFDEYGRWGDAMDNKAQGYSSSTRYLILVDKTKFKVRVYQGSRGNWTRIKDWRCTHGGSDTPNGVFTIDDHVTKRDARYGWADFDYSSAAYACHISAGNYFHSILYNKGTRGNPYNQSGNILDPKMGTTYSHGCIRLELDNAKWVWDNIPFGTRVVVYNS